LVLAGGGANGAYQVGAIQHLATIGRRYDLICGTSVGALNGAFLAQFADDALGAIRLLDLWNRIEGDRSIYRKWPLWPVSIIGRQSVYDTTPLNKLIDTLSPTAVKNSGKKLRVVAVAWGSAEVKVWTEHDADLRDGVRASSSFPIFFPPVLARGTLWTDGGVRDITPLREAVKLGATQIDVIMCSPRGCPEELGTRIGILTQLRRVLEILLDEVAQGDIARTVDMNTLVRAGAAPGKREIGITLLRPKTKLGDSLNFDRTKNRELIKRGTADARTIWP
jgi:NTE family protein